MSCIPRGEHGVIFEELRSSKQPARVLWLAGSELHAAMGRLLEAQGISLLPPASFEQTGVTLPDLVLLGDDGGGTAALEEIARATPALSDVPVLTAPCGAARLDDQAREPFVELLAGAIRALACTHPAAERALQRRCQGEMAARLRCEMGELRMTRLVEVSAALSRSATQAEVASVVLTQGVQALYADTGHVGIVRGDELDVVFMPGFPEDIAAVLRRATMTSQLPTVDCIRRRRTRIYASPEEIRAEFPDLPSALPFKTCVYLPLLVHDLAVGVIVLLYREPTSFGQDDLRYMDLLARQCALALERARLYEMEREARRAREEALAIAAHDLRTPLTSISLSAALLERCADEKIRHKGRVIRTAAERASELLRDLLDAAVIEQGKLRVHVAPCDGAALLGELRELFLPLAEQKRITLRIGTSGDVGSIAVDRARMHQALANLLGNALKFTPEGGTIEAHASAGDGRLRVVVRDSGPGVAPEGMPRLFDRYWQARAMKRTGVGLGLYIVKGIVEAHGGSVHVDSAPGAGTTFTLEVALGAH